MSSSKKSSPISLELRTYLCSQHRQCGSQTYASGLDSCSGEQELEGVTWAGISQISLKNIYEGLPSSQILCMRWGHSIDKKVHDAYLLQLRKYPWTQEDVGQSVHWSIMCNSENSEVSQMPINWRLQNKLCDIYKVENHPKFVKTEVDLHVERHLGPLMLENNQLYKVIYPVGNAI